MSRVLVLGMCIAIGCGALLGITLAYEQWVFAMGALILGVGSASVVALASPEPVPAVMPVTLGGPVVRPTIELDDELEETEPEPADAPAAGPAPRPVLVPLDPDRTVPTAA